MGSLVKSILKKYGHDRTQLLDMLRDIQKEERLVSDSAITQLAEGLGISRVAVEGPATFYHFYSREHRGRYTVYLNNSATAMMCGYKEVAKTFEEELETKFGETSKDLEVGLYATSCIGMCDQEPAALINDVVFTQLTPEKVKKIVAGLKAKKDVRQLVEEYGDGMNASPLVRSMVKNHIRKTGPVFFSEFRPGESLKKVLSMNSLDVIEEVKKSGLRGRGGAGFPTGTKWGFCRSTPSDTRYVMCNVDEGEPGTFKDRVLLTERAALIFEGMTIAGYSLEAKEGIMYLRGEYAYLKPYLEAILEDMRKNKLLGKNILGHKFDFDIIIKMGAGAYICGEESALIESAEGKRGEPRNRPPFPVQVGYMGKPTVVNNPETYGCVVRILQHGANWFKGKGTKESAGVKLLSVSGDCADPGIYEVEFGVTVEDVLKLSGAKDVQAVQVGGPSGQLIDPSQFKRKICYNDLGTGGAFCIIGKQRDLLEIVHNFMDFFQEESCGFCVPCRAGNVLLKKMLDKILEGHGTVRDLESMEQWCGIIKTASRCGLGQTSPNPIQWSLKNFRELYEKRVRKDVEFVTQFDMSQAVVESCDFAGRKPKITEGHH